MIGDERTREKVKGMVVGEKVDSDHQPIVIWIEGKNMDGREVGRGREEEEEHGRRKVGRSLLG